MKSTFVFIANDIQLPHYKKTMAMRISLLK